MKHPSLSPSSHSLHTTPEDFEDVIDLYITQIQPYLKTAEESRKRAVKMLGLGLCCGLIPGSLISLYMMTHDMQAFFDSLPILKIDVQSDTGWYVALVPLILGAMMFGIMAHPFAQLKKAAKAMIIEPIAEKLGLNYSAEPGPQSNIEEFRDIKLVPNADEESFEDRFAGAHKSVEFSFYEAHLEKWRGSGKSRRLVTVFKGQCLRLHFQKEFLGRTLVARDGGFFSAFGGVRGLSRAKLEDPVFETAFDVYTSDQVEARYLLTPDFMQRLVDLEAAFHGKKLRCAFVRGELLITMEGDNLFEPGHMFKPMDDPQRVTDILRDFLRLNRLIETLTQ